MEGDNLLGSSESGSFSLSPYQGQFAGDKTPQMCGHSVFSKMVRKSPSKPDLANDYPPSKSCMTIGKKSPFPRRKYSEVDGTPRSPDLTESSSSDSDKSSDKLLQSFEANSTNAYFVQFDPEEINKLEEEKNKVLMPSKPQRASSNMGFRSSGWSTTLSAVSEEPSNCSEDMSQDRDFPETSSTKLLSPKKNHSSPEKNEMLAAMRSLVLKQQNALRDMSEQNNHFRNKLGQYQNMLIKMKQEQSRKDGTINQLLLEKEALEAEAMYLREEIKAVGGDIETEDEDLQRKLSDLMNIGNELESPSFTSQMAADVMFDGFKKSLGASPRKSPRTRFPQSSRSRTGKDSLLDPTAFDKAVMSLTCSDPAEWSCESRDDRSISSRPFDEDHSTVEPNRTLSTATSSTDQAASLQEDVTMSRTSSSLWSNLENDEKVRETKDKKSSKAKTEEMALFKQRLESIQMRRTHRQLSDKKRNNKPQVSFGTLVL